MSDTFVSNINSPGPQTLLILLDARNRVGALFSTWAEIAATTDDDELAPAAEAFRSLDRSITQLGGPTIETTYEIMHGVLGNVPGEIDDEPAVASVILQHCASIAAAS